MTVALILVSRRLLMGWMGLNFNIGVQFRIFVFLPEFQVLQKQLPTVALYLKEIDSL